MIREPLHYNLQQSPYRALIGTGGIGSGMFFALKGNHTLGREESRGGWFQDRRDYCKLHIITHYVKALLGPEFSVILVGKVGSDVIGKQLIQEMSETGLAIRNVTISSKYQTLFSLCFTYPDGTGGNLTAEDSASASVDKSDIDMVEAEFDRYQSRGVALAAPEVPLPARKRLLELATRAKFLRVGSFVSAEINEAMQMGLFGLLDILALNIHEAAQVIGINAEAEHPWGIIERAIHFLSREYPALRISLTAGKNGSWSWDGEKVNSMPAFPTRVVNTAGAGDAHLAGIITGLVTGLSFEQSQEFGGLVAALSITSPHTIAPEVDRVALLHYVMETGVSVHPSIYELLA